MIKVRKNFFETNSSSTHSIVIDDNLLEKKKLYDVRKSDYGRGVYTYNTPDQRASYIFTLIKQDHQGRIEDFVEKLKEITGQSEEEIFYDSEMIYRSNYGYSGYVDHGDERDIQEILNNLEQIIWGKGSEIRTGNDNGGEEDCNDPDSETYNKYRVLSR